MATSLKTVTEQGPYEQSVRAAWERNQALLEPDWLQALRLKALSRYEVLGVPTRRHEAWKYINLRELLDTEFQPYTVKPDPQTLKERLKFHWLEGGGQTVRFVFVNGRFEKALSAGLETDTGAVLASMEEALKSQQLLLQDQMDRYLAEEPDAFAALNMALFEDGAFVYVPENTVVEPLVQLVFVNTGDVGPKAAYLRNLIRLERGAKLNLSVQFLGFDTDEPYLSNLAQAFQLDEQAELNVSFLQFEGCKSWHFSAHRAWLASDSKLALNTVTLAGLVGRHSVQAVMQGENAQCHLNGLNVLEGKTEVYHHTVIEHWQPNCRSRQFYKGILEDDAKSEFNGTIFVAPDAQQTDSEQLNHNLVLSDNARVYTRPQLQINADDVKCAHGATVGQLQEDQLFYLASRGIDEKTARGILTYGFAEDIIQRIPHRAVRQYLDVLVLDNLHDTDNATIGQLKGCQLTNK